MGQCVHTALAICAFCLYVCDMITESSATRGSQAVATGNYQRLIQEKMRNEKIKGNAGQKALIKAMGGKKEKRYIIEMVKGLKIRCF